MKRRFAVFFTIIVLALVIFSVSVSANEADYNASVISSEGLESAYLLNDGNNRSYTTLPNGGCITVSRDGGISFLYIVFDRIPEKWTLTDLGSGKITECGTNSFLHEYVDVSALFESMPETVQLTFPAGASIDEIYAFGEGDVPEWVQRWSPPCDKADIMLISSHADDEQLFFAGVLPIYAGERGLNVQVVYLVNHFLNTEEYARLRPHEQLDGLWTVGVRNYPVMSLFPDPYSESIEGALEAYGAYGFTYDDFTEYITDCLRRFKPLVVVTHDVNGEYGHGTHILCTAALKDALKLAGDAEAFPDSYEKYGTWQVLKTYLHLYPENGIILDLDSPLSHFGGKTAFEVTQDGFACHKSQHWTWFYGWIYGENGNIITKATEIETYSPCFYGLYSTSVGYDIAGGDFMENVDSYAVRDENKTTEEPDDTREEATTHENEASAIDEYNSVSNSKGTNENRKYVLLCFFTAILIAIVLIVVCFVRSRSIKRIKNHRRRHK